MTAEHTPRTRNSTTALDSLKPKRCEMPVAQVLVKVVVVSLAKTPFSEAQPPDAMA